MITAELKFEETKSKLLVFLLEQKDNLNSLETEEVTELISALEVYTYSKLDMLKGSLGRRIIDNQLVPY